MQDPLAITGSKRRALLLGEWWLFSKCVTNILQSIIQISSTSCANHAGNLGGSPDECKPAILGLFIIIKYYVALTMGGLVLSCHACKTHKKFSRSIFHGCPVWSNVSPFLVFFKINY